MKDRGFERRLRERKAEVKQARAADVKRRKAEEELRFQEALKKENLALTNLATLDKELELRSVVEVAKSELKGRQIIKHSDTQRLIYKVVLDSGEYEHRGPTEWHPHIEEGYFSRRRWWGIEIGCDVASPDQINIKVGEGGDTLKKENLSRFAKVELRPGGIGHVYHHRIEFNFNSRDINHLQELINEAGLMSLV